MATDNILKGCDSVFALYYKSSPFQSNIIHCFMKSSDLVKTILTYWKKESYTKIKAKDQQIFNVFV